MSEQEFGKLPRGTSPAKAMFDYVRGTGAAEAMLTSPAVPSDPFGETIDRMAAAMEGVEPPAPSTAAGVLRAAARAPRAVVAEEAPAGVDVDALSPEQFALLQAAVDNRSDLELNEAARTLGLTDDDCGGTRR